MLTAFRWSRVTLLVLAIVAVTFATGSSARAAAAPPAPAIGVIDQDAISRDYFGFKDAMARMNKFVEERQSVYKDLQAGVGLTADDYKEYRARIGGATIDKKRIQELQAQAKKNMDEYQTLKAKEKDLTDVEKTRMAQLEKDMGSVQDDINEQASQLNAEIQEESSRYRRVLTDLVDKALAKVGETKKLGIIVSKNIQSGESTERFVLWGGLDITDDVVKLLNGAYKGSLLDKPATPAGPATPR